MSPWALLALTLTLIATIAAWRWPWRPAVGHSRWRLLFVVAMAVGLAAAALCAALTAPTARLLVLGHVVAGLCGVLGGGPLTAAVLHLAPDGSTTGRPPTHVLRGGGTIGLLERAAVVGTLQAGWPEGVAVAMAIKALGRYPELRHPGTSERFIVGTFASVLWAAACAGVVFLG